MIKSYKKLLISMGLSLGLLSGCSWQETVNHFEHFVENLPPQMPTQTPDITNIPPQTNDEPSSEHVTLTPEMINPQTPTPTPNLPPKGMVVSYLTGEYVPEEIGRRRPIAVMLSNSKAACPQAGIANAGVVYEALAEGGITRLMGIFEDYDNLDKIGSVRSCRDYFIFYASGFNAIYTHYGQSAYAKPFLELPQVNNLSGLAGYGSKVFYRTSDRKSPHNAYTSAEGLQTGIELNDYTQEYAADYLPGYTFCGVDAEVELPQVYEAHTVKPGYPVNKPWFEYNEEEKVYYRYQYGDIQIDELTQEPLKYKNIILQYSSWRYYEDGMYLNIDVDAPNKGIYIVNGKAIDITWKKHTPWGATFYYDTNGYQITMDTGSTWVCIILDSLADNVEILGAE